MHTMPKGHSHQVPGIEGKPATEKKWLPKLIAWEVTRSCNLNCIHGRAAARFGPYPNELKTKECLAFLDDVAKAFPSFIIILTGGEPMMRDDIWEIAAHGTKLGLRMVMAPCAVRVREEGGRSGKGVGTRRGSCAIDGINAERHD